jgi:hypothetical protein
MRQGSDTPRHGTGHAWLCAAVLACLSTALRAGGGIEHVVFIWLHEPGNSGHRARVLEESRVLARIPGVTGLKRGTVVPGARAVVDGSYDVGLIVSLADQAALDDYLAHPLHVQLVNETLKPLVKRIQVYDMRRSEPAGPAGSGMP